jgi:hypothetical protein
LKLAVDNYHWILQSRIDDSSTPSSTRWTCMDPFLDTTVLFLLPVGGVRTFCRGGFASSVDLGRRIFIFTRANIMCKTKPNQNKGHPSHHLTMSTTPTVTDEELQNDGTLDLYSETKRMLQGTRSLVDEFGGTIRFLSLLCCQDIAPHP